MSLDTATIIVSCKIPLMTIASVAQMTKLCTAGIEARAPNASAQFKRPMQEPNTNIAASKSTVRQLL